MNTSMLLEAQAEMGRYIILGIIMLIKVDELPT